MEYKSIGELITKTKEKYTSQTVRISEYVDYSQYDTINKIEAYLYGKFWNGATDEKGRPRAFFDIITSAVNIWYRATRRRSTQLRVKAGKSKSAIESLFATVFLRKWLEKSDFDTFLEDWGMTLARYGTAISKHVEKDNVLYNKVINWNTVISDPQDFYNNPVIEQLFLTPSQILGNKSFKKDQVERLLNNLSYKRDLRGGSVGGGAEGLQVYEIHGKLPKSFITGKDEDKNTLVQQMHIVAFVGETSDKENCNVLVSAEEETNPYLITSLLPDKLREMARGAVELLFDAQWMQNHSQKLIKDQMEIISKVVLQTADETFVGKNMTTNLDTGDILITEVGKPLTQVNLGSHDIQTMQSFAREWKALSQEITSTPEALRGETPNAGTAYRLQQLVVNESLSLFDDMGYHKDIAIKEMFRTFIVPYIKKQLKTKEEIMATLEDSEIQRIDNIFIKNKARAEINKKVISDILDKGLTQTLEEINEEEAELQNELKAKLADLQGERPFKPDEIDEKTWEDILKDLDWDIEIVTPSDQRNINLQLETLTNVFQTIANPATAGVLNTPQGKFLFNEILNLTGGISPVKMSDITANPIGGN